MAANNCSWDKKQQHSRAELAEWDWDPAREDSGMGGRENT